MSWEEINRELEGITLEQREIIQRMIEDQHIEDRDLDRIKIFLSGTPSALQADELIHWLHSLKPDRVDSGYNYSQTDITFKLLKFI